MSPYREPVKKYQVFDHTCRRCSRWGFQKLYEPYIYGAGPLCTECFIEWTGVIRGQFGTWSIAINSWPLDFYSEGRYQYTIKTIKTESEPLDLNLKLPDDFTLTYKVKEGNCMGQSFELTKESFFTKIKNKFNAFF